MNEKTEMITRGKSLVERMDEWMERLFIREPQIRPIRAAALCIHYSGYDMELKPLITQRARRIKKKLALRVPANLVS
jgi:hypothetical protein